MLSSLARFGGLSLTALACSNVTIPPTEDDVPPSEEGEAQLEWSIDGSQSGFGPVSEPVDLAITSDGTTLLAGIVSVADPNIIRACSLERFAADGTYLGLTEYTTSPQGKRLDNARAITLGPNGEIILLCVGVLDNSDLVSAWVGWLASDGTLLAETELPDLMPSDILSTPDANEVIVVGDDKQTGDGTYQHVSQQGPTGVAVTLQVDEGFYPAVPAVSRHPGGWTAVIHSTSLTPSTNELLRIDGVTPTSLGPACGVHLAVALDGAIYTSSDFSTPTMRICRHVESGGAWTVQEWPVTISDSSVVMIHDIDTDALGNVVIAGVVGYHEGMPGGPQHMFGRGYSPSGEVLWSDEFASPDERGFAWARAIAARRGRVVYAGRHDGNTNTLGGTVLRSLQP